MIVVIDASIAAKWVVAEAGSAEALKILELDLEFIAPDIICAELTNIFHKKMIMNEMKLEQAILGIQNVAAVVRCVQSNPDLCADALQLAQALKHSAYDCLYLALALSGGILVTADEVFLRKCQDSGLGSFVARPDDLTDLHTGSHPRPSIAPETFDDIDRLAATVEATMGALMSFAREGLEETRFRFVSTAALAPAFDSPAYRRLGDLLATLGREQLAFLLALGWLGRSYNQKRDWPSLIENAQLLAQEGYAMHKSYFIAQMKNVRTGLSKLTQNGRLEFQAKTEE